MNSGWIALALMGLMCVGAAGALLGALPGGKGGRGALGAGLVAAVFAMTAGGIYALNGRPDLLFRTPASTAPELIAAGGAPVDISALEAEWTRLSEAEAAAPADWGSLGAQYREAGRFDRAAGAFLRAAALLQGEPGETAFLGAYAEALVARDQGQISEAAERAFRKIESLNPGDPGANYYLGLAAFQNGYSDDAKARWTALWARTPRDAPWREVLAASLGRIGVDVASLPAPSPPILAGEDVGDAPGPAGPLDEDARAAIEALSEEDQRAFIEDRVTSFGDRLRETASEDPDAWANLARMEALIGRREAARDAIDRAIELAPGNEAFKSARERLLASPDGTEATAPLDEDAARERP